jgi:hypothetical protein
MERGVVSLSGKPEMVAEILGENAGTVSTYFSNFDKIRSSSDGALNIGN